MEHSGPSRISPLWRLAIVGAVLGAAGCDAVTNIGRSSEERINAAYPLSPEIAVAQARLEEKLAGDAAARAQFATELSGKMKLRAIGCAKGYSPSLFSSSATIRERVGEAKCFTKFDAELVDWLNGRRVQWLLAGPPLRPIPTQAAPLIAAGKPIGQVRFAAEAGVALVTGYQLLEIVDLGSGDTIFVDKDIPYGLSYAEISPNGALFAIPLVSPTQAGVVVRDSATGETVAELHDLQRLMWLDSATAVVTRRNAQGLELYDFASGTTSPIKGISGVPTRILAVPEEPATFVAVSQGSLLKFRLSRKHDEPEITLLEQAPGAAVSDAGGVTAAGKAAYLQAGGDLLSVDLATLRTTRTSFKPLQVVSATPLADPTEVLLVLSIGERSSLSSKVLVYSMTDGTFQAVEDERITGPTYGITGYTGVRSVFISSLRQMAVISGATLKPITDIRRGFRYSTEALTQQMQQEDRERLEKAAQATARQLGYAATGTLNGVPIMQGPVAELAKDARVEAIGVYQSAGGSRGFGRPSTAGPVQIVLRRSSAPIVLVLSSYEPVNWNLINHGADLKAVLLAGAGNSTVNGTGAARLVRIGAMHPYQRDEQFAALQREVIRWSGKSIELFQGQYSGSTFTVGGL